MGVTSQEAACGGRVTLAPPQGSVSEWERVVSGPRKQPGFPGWARFVVACWWPRLDDASRGERSQATEGGHPHWPLIGTWFLISVFYQFFSPCLVGIPFDTEVLVNLPGLPLSFCWGGVSGDVGPNILPQMGGGLNDTSLLCCSSSPGAPNQFLFLFLRFRLLLRLSPRVYSCVIREEQGELVFTILSGLEISNLL